MKAVWTDSSMGYQQYGVTAELVCSGMGLHQYGLVVGHGKDYSFVSISYCYYHEYHYY